MMDMMNTLATELKFMSTEDLQDFKKTLFRVENLNEHKMLERLRVFKSDKEASFALDYAIIEAEALEKQEKSTTATSEGLKFSTDGVPSIDVKGKATIDLYTGKGHYIYTGKGNSVGFDGNGAVTSTKMFVEGVGVIDVYPSDGNAISFKVTTEDGQPLDEKIQEIVSNIRAELRKLGANSGIVIGESY